MPLFFLLLLMLCIGSCAMPLRTYAQTVQKASSLKQARKKKLEGITKIKKDYYYLVGGKPLTSREGKVIREEKAEEEEVYRLFVDRDGKLTKGWHQIGHRLYYCREKGIIKEKGKVDGLQIGKYGYVTATKEHLRKVMGGSLEMTSAQVVASVAGSASGKHHDNSNGSNTCGSKNQEAFLNFLLNTLHECCLTSTSFTCNKEGSIGVLYKLKSLLLLLIERLSGNDFLSHNSNIYLF